MNESKEFIRAKSRLISQHPELAVPLFTLGESIEVPPGTSVAIPTRTGGTAATRIDTAATDGTKAYFSRKFMTEDLKSTDERVFVLAHEALHWILRHAQRALEWDKRIIGPDGKRFNWRKWNIAGDIWINSVLVESGIGKFPEWGGVKGDIDSEKVSVEDIYKTLPEEEEGDGQDHTGNFDQHLPPSPEQVEDMPSEQEVQDAVNQGLSTAKMAGKEPGLLGRIFGQIVDPKANWEDLLRAALTNSLGVEEMTFARVNRRMLVLPPHYIMPSTTGFSPGSVNVVVDISGSVSDEEYNRFMSEVSGILADARPKALRLDFWDMCSHGTFEIEEYGELEDHMKPSGGRGGTDMEAAFHDDDMKHWAQCQEGEIVHVCLTDGYTSSTRPPTDARVIWCTTGSEDLQYGEVIKVDI